MHILAQREDLGAVVGNIHAHVMSFPFSASNITPTAGRGKSKKRSRRSKKAPTTSFYEEKLSSQTGVGSSVLRVLSLVRNLWMTGGIFALIYGPLPLLLRKISKVPKRTGTLDIVRLMLRESKGGGGEKPSGLRHLNRCSSRPSRCSSRSPSRSPSRHATAMANKKIGPRETKE